MRSPQATQSGTAGGAIDSGERLERMLAFDADALRHGTDTGTELAILIGTDEVGRGCLAGPVVAAAVILPKIKRGSELFLKLARLNDSKLVPPAVREQLAEVLKTNCSFAVAEASVAEIDTINILNASLLAMRRAVQQLKIKSAQLVLVDGNRKVPRLRGTQMPVIQGDSQSASIAAASIIAKVHRDHLMRQLAHFHPQYGWHSNKGYGSSEHRAALAEHGRTPWHRLSFNCGINDQDDDV
jgi:ribonuclease HII